MTNALSSSIDRLARRFTASIMVAIHASSLAEILDIPQRKLGGDADADTTRGADVASRRRAGRPVGVTKRNTETTVELLVKYLRSHPGSSGEEARKDLGLAKHTLNARVSRAIKDGKVRKEGDRRATGYWAASEPGT